MYQTIETTKIDKTILENYQLVLIPREKNEKKTKETKKLSPRQLQFRRDDALPLCKKYFNKKYVKYKSQILAEIEKKFENVKKRKNKTDKIYRTYLEFYEKLSNEKPDIFNVETDDFF
jgi:hypothetical protein